MRLVFAGTPDVAVTALDALLASKHEVVAVLTRPPAPSGRGRGLAPSPVHARAQAAGIEVFTPQRVTEPSFLAALRALEIECAPVVAYGALLPAEVLDIPTHGWVNLHFSLLPRWRGAAPVQAAIINGDEVTGATTFRIDAGLDTGPMYGSVIEPLSGNETSGELLSRLASSGAQLLVDTMDGIDAGSLHAVPQPDEGVTIAPKLSVDDARVDWSAAAETIDRSIRGCTPNPGAWTTLRGERVKIVAAERADLPSAGHGVATVNKRSVWVGTASDSIELLTVQAQGKKPMAAADWARGVRLTSGESFE